MTALVVVASVLASLGAWITGINFYLSFIRYPMHRLMQRDKPYKWISGFPFVGSLFLWLAAVLFWWLDFRHWAFGAVAFSLLDTGGPIWFLITIASEAIKGKP